MARFEADVSWLVGEDSGLFSRLIWDFLNVYWSDMVVLYCNHTVVMFLLTMQRWCTLLYHVVVNTSGMLVIVC